MLALKEKQNVNEVEALTSSKSRFKLLPMPTGSGKMICRPFRQCIVLDTFLVIPIFKTHSFKHYFTCWGYSSEQTRQKFLPQQVSILTLSFLCTQEYTVFFLLETHLPSFP